MPFESEFHGVAAEEQKSRIELGLDEIERRTNVRPSTFVPPFDAYDSATLGAVEALGMRAISGGLGPSSGENLNFLPNTVYIKRIREAVLRLREDADPGAVIVSIFHPWDMEEADQMVPLTGGSERPVNLKQLDSMLDWLRKQPEVRVSTIEALGKSGADIGEKRFAMAREHSRSALWRILPPRLKGPPKFYLHSVVRYRHRKVESWLRALTYSLAIVVLVSGIVSAGLRSGRRVGGLPAMIPRVAMALGAVVFLGGPWLMGALGWKDFIVLLIALGICLGGALALLEMRNASPQPGT